MKTPLAQRMRPQTLEDMVGQQHLISPGKMLRNIIGSNFLPNMIFYGPPGTGKTTLASIIAQRTNRKLYKLSATTASSADIKEIIKEIDTFQGLNGVLLYLDEIQYMNKKQQQTLLTFLEDGSITLLAATTENPNFYVYGALLSRCAVFEFKPVPKTEVKKVVSRAFEILAKDLDRKFAVEDGVCESIAQLSGGDVRKAIGTAEICALSADLIGETYKISQETLENLAGHAVSRADKNGDEHYDLLSALQKSMRGSDADASVYYLARALQMGDLPGVCRRILVCACEDVGLAYPQIMPIVKSCVDIALQVGMPEARIPLANAVILVANSPKSNSAYMAVNLASDEVQNGGCYPLPRILQNKHYDGADSTSRGQNYKYPHDFPQHWVAQQYLPDELAGASYYTPGGNKTEQQFAAYQEKIRRNA